MESRDVVNIHAARQRAESRFNVERWRCR